MVEIAVELHYDTVQYIMILHKTLAGKMRRLKYDTK